jgi:hypothetical protein
MLRVGHVARDRDHTIESGHRSLECRRSAGVDHEPPLALHEGADERETEAARGAGDDADGGAHAAVSTGSRSRASRRS